MNKFDIDVSTKVVDIFLKNILIICDESQHNLFSKIKFSSKETEKNGMRFLATHNAAIGFKLNLYNFVFYVIFFKIFVLRTFYGSLKKMMKKQINQKLVL